MESQNSETESTWETSLQFLDRSETRPTLGVTPPSPSPAPTAFVGVKACVHSLSAGWVLPATLGAPTSPHHQVPLSFNTSLVQ